MNYKTEKLPNEPITIWTGYEGFEWGTPEEKKSNAELRVIWEASVEPIYHIADMSYVKMDLEKLMKAAADVALGEEALWTHPKLKLAVIVTQDPLILRAAESVAQSMESGAGPYHQVPMMIVGSVDEALDYIRDQM
jgi:hypothetical protein